MITKVILDTDMGSDCDDAGALALLHNFEMMGTAQILAVTHCTTEIGGAITIKAINEWYNNDIIPVGRRFDAPFFEDEKCKVYTSCIAKDYLSSHSMPIFENSVRLIRKILSTHNNVTLIAIGFLNNMADLLKSTADDISPLSGFELVEKNVCTLYVMGGNFANLNDAEYNIRCDVNNAQYLATHFPKPIVYCGFEIGATIRTGASLRKNSMVKKIYEIFSPDALRESWDPATVYAAIATDTHILKKSKPVTISFSDEGKVLLSPGKKDCYLTFEKKPSHLARAIEDLMI